jgi:23S rRNA A2030 N6-methylase RlmJ
MNYDHSTKIGNEGDVVKHAVLHNSVLQITQSLRNDSLFKYVESHAGRPCYVLPDGGEWNHGIKLLTSKSKDARKPYPLIDSYFEAHLSPKIKVGQQYFGSSNIVFRSLRSNDCKFSFNLYEIDSNAFDDLMRFYLPWHDAVRLTKSDGYEGVLCVSEASLVLIDPHSLDDDRIIKCIAHLKSRGISYICWTPRNSSSKGKKEGQDHFAFGERTDLGHHSSIRWAEPSGAAQHTFGCRVTVSDDLKIIAEDTTKQLISLFSEDNWKLG